MKEIEYRGIKIEIVKEDDDYCFSFYIGNNLYLGQLQSEERAIQVAKADIDHEFGANIIENE